MSTPVEIDIIQSVLTKPKMYTTNSTIGEASAFLAGYFWGLRKLNPRPDGIENWDDFIFYLREQVNVNSINIWKEIEQKFGDDALPRTKQFYLDFKALKSQK